jgi:hypothetical protein
VQFFLVVGIPQPLLDSGSSSPQGFRSSAALLVLQPRGGNHSAHFGGVCILWGNLVSDTIFGGAAKVYSGTGRSEFPRMVESSGAEGAQASPCGSQLAYISYTIVPVEGP